MLVYLCLVRVFTAGVAQLPLLEEKLPDPEMVIGSTYFSPGPILAA